MGRKFLTTPTLPALPSAPSSPSVGDMYFDTTLGKIGVYTSSGWVYYLYQIEDGSVTTTKIADGAVTSSKLAPGTAVANLGYTPVNKAGDTMSGSLTVPSLLGPDNANLLISGRSYGVEIRIDEDSSGSDTFRITRGSGGSTTLMLVQNTGNVGIGTNSPTQKLDVAGNVSGVQFISTATTGTAPFQVNSTTKVNNLNADLLDGYDASTSSTDNTIAVRDSSGNISANRFISTVASGTAPLQVSSNTLVTNLNADLLDGYNSSTNSTPSTVAVRDASGNLSASSFISTASTGTAPFQISSTTKVANLNADLLDGYNSTDFARKAENATITGNWTFNGNLTIQQGRLISYNTNHKVLYPRWGFATNQGNSHGKWQKIGTFTFSVNYTKCHIHAIAWGGRDIDDPYSTQHLVMELDTGNSNSIDTTNYILGLYLEHVPTSGTARYAIRDARIVIPDPTNAPNVAELWVQWNISWATISPEVHIIGPSNVTINIATDLADDANTAPTSPPSTGTVLSPNHTSIAELANKLATARTISLGGSLSGSTTFDGSSNVTINASINSGAVGTTQIADGAVTASKLASGAVTGNLGYTPVNKAGDTMTGTLVLTSTTPMQVTSSTLITNLNADLVDGYHASDFPRKSENATISGTWTFSATPSFGSGLRFTGGTSTWTSNEWAKVADLFKGQALVWRTGGGLSVGLGVAGSTNALYFSSSTVDDNSAPASYPIVFDMENGRIGIGTTGPTEKIDIRTGNIRVDSSAVIKFGDRRTINVYVDHGSDTNTRYYYLGKIHSNIGILKVQGIMGGHTPSEGRANVDLQFSARSGFRADGEAIGNIGRADIYVYAPSGDSYIYVYLVTNTWALVNLELSSVGMADIEFNGTYATSPPNLGTPIFQLSTDTSNNILWVDSNRNVKASRFISTVGTGTAPLQVSSTTKVDNLNADLLDGYDSTDFPRKNENATITGSWTFNNNISAGSVSTTIGTLTVNNNATIKGDLVVEGGSNAIAIKESSSDSTPGYLEKVSGVLQLSYTSTSPVRVYRGTTAGQADLEIFKDAASGELPIYLRFHQNSRHYESIKATNGLISFVNGNDTGYIDIQAQQRNG
jgi:hypothetical protein